MAVGKASRRAAAHPEEIETAKRKRLDRKPGAGQDKDAATG